MRMNFVKSGYVDIVYAKDTVQDTNTSRSGIFDIYVDDILMFHDEDLNDNPDNWKFKSLNIPEGEHEVTLVYQKYNTQATKDLMFELKVRYLKSM